VNIAEKKDAHGKGRIIAFRGENDEAGRRQENATKTPQFSGLYRRIASQLAEETGAALAFGWRSGLPLR
jgi:hypothetical protein